MERLTALASKEGVKRAKREREVETGSERDMFGLCRGFSETLEMQGGD